MGWEVPTIAFALTAMKDALISLAKKGSARKQKAALSTVVSELLKLDPDITVAEAQLTAIDVVGAKPSPEMLRAKSMLDAVKSHRSKRRVAEKAARRRSTRRVSKRAISRKR